MSIKHKSKFGKAESFQNLTSAEIKALFRKAFHETAFHPYTELPVDKLAIKAGVSTQLIYNAANKNLDWKCSMMNVVSIMQASQNPAILEVLSSAMGYFIFKVELTKTPGPEKILSLMLQLKVSWEKLLQQFERFYAAGAEDQEALQNISEGLFAHINCAALLRASTFTKQRMVGKK